MNKGIGRLAATQDGVITRAQLVEHGLRPGLLADRVRQGRWQRAFPGVAVVHGGPLTWRTRARAALLYCGRGAALSHSAAAYHWGMSRSEPRLVEISVPWDRRVTGQRGLQIHLRRVMPPSQGALRAIHAPEVVIDLWKRERDVDAALSLLAAAARVLASMSDVARAAAARPRLPRRQLLEDLLREVEEGVESPLERRYRCDVERSHGLPVSALQVRQRLGTLRIRADVVYVGLGVRVELDGQLGHPGGRTASDAWRDNAVVIASGEMTLRYRWAHVVGAPCATAGQVAQALARGGWRGRPQPCGPACRL